MPFVSRAAFFVIHVLLLLLASRAAEGAALPRLIGNQTLAACKQALAIAREAFESGEADLRHARPVPPGIPVRLVLAIAAGEAYAEQPLFEFFGKTYEGSEAGRYLPMAPEDSVEGIYLQQANASSTRLAIRKTWFGGGAGFEVRVYPANATVERIAQWRDDDARDGVGGYFPPRVYAKSGGHDWWLLSGDGFGPFSAWTVHVLRDGSLWQPCTVQFLPARFNLMRSLPPAARRLEKLLSQTLGPGKNEGTLQPTARLKGEAEAAWTALLMRPWADITPPYNTRQAVDRELARWARNGPTHLRLHRAILRQLPRAERAVAARYRTSFHMTPREASRRAAINTDLVFRSHYVFPY